MAEISQPPSPPIRCSSSLAAQRGVSLVELLVGLAIGLLVTLAALGIVSFTRITSTTVTESVRLQQDASIIMRIVGIQLRQARSVALQTTLVDSGVGAVGYQAYQGSVPPGGATEVAVFGTEGGAAPDTFTVSTGVLNGLTTDCLGFQAGPGVNTIVSTLAVIAGSLSCQGVTGNFEPMVANVEDLQVWYGVVDPLTGNVRYLNANQVGVANWTAVGSVMLCLRLRGTTQNIPNPGAGNVFRGCQNEVVAWDGRFRRVFRKVFTLRNPA